VEIDVIDMEVVVNGDQKKEEVDVLIDGGNPKVSLVVILINLVVVWIRQRKEIDVENWSPKYVLLIREVVENIIDVEEMDIMANIIIRLEWMVKTDGDSIETEMYVIIIIIIWMSMDEKNIIKMEVEIV